LASASVPELWRRWCLGEVAASDRERCALFPPSGNGSINCNSSAAPRLGAHRLGAINALALAKGVPVLALPVGARPSLPPPPLQLQRQQSAPGFGATSSIGEATSVTAPAFSKAFDWQKYLPDYLQDESKTALSPQSRGPTGQQQQQRVYESWSQSVASTSLAAPVSQQLPHLQDPLLRLPHCAVAAVPPAAAAAVAARALESLLLFMDSAARANAARAAAARSAGTFATGAAGVSDAAAGGERDSVAGTVFGARAGVFAAGRAL